jgi:hypothetical protein
MICSSSETRSVGHDSVKKYVRTTEIPVVKPAIEAPGRYRARRFSSGKNANVRRYSGTQHRDSEQQFNVDELNCNPANNLPKLPDDVAVSERDCRLVVVNAIHEHV